MTPKPLSQHPDQQEARRWPLYICPVCGEGTTNNILHLHSQPEHENEQVDVIEAAPCKALESRIEELTRELEEERAGWPPRSDYVESIARTNNLQSLITETVKAVDEAYAYLRLGPDQDHTRHGIACGQDACILCLTEEVLRSCAAKLKGEA